MMEDLDTLGAAGSDGQVIVATGAGAFQYESGATLRTSVGVGTGDTPILIRFPNGNISIKTIETLHNDWVPYEEFKPFDISVKTLFIIKFSDRDFIYIG